MLLLFSLLMLLVSFKITRSMNCEERKLRFGKSTTVIVYGINVLVGSFMLCILTYHNNILGNLIGGCSFLFIFNIPFIVVVPLS